MDINVHGEIIQNDDKWIYDWCEIESFCPKDLEDAIISANGEEISLLINSPGGDVNAASAMRSRLKAYKGKSKAIITGISASAATVLMTGADKVEAYVTAIFMVHQASTYTRGNSDDIQKTKNMLDEYNRAIANSYAEKTGKSVDECLQLMKDETWMSVEKALDNKLIDNIISNSTAFNTPVTNYFRCSITNKMRKQALEEKEKAGNSLGNGKSPTSIDIDEIANRVITILDEREQEKQKQLKNSLLKDLGQYGK